MYVLHGLLEEPNQDFSCKEMVLIVAGNRSSVLSRTRGVQSESSFYAKL